MSIYDRQETIKLNTNKTVSVVGAGGVGYWVAKFLAMSGVDKIIVYDFDLIEESNLNRLDLPFAALGKNKAEVAKRNVLNIRPSCTIKAVPFKFSENLFSMNPTDVIVDCTDKEKVQKVIEAFAKKYGVTYCKAGYDGEHMTISNSIPDWSTTDEDDGYRITPSWVVPSVVVASLTVAKVLKYMSMELSSNISDMFRLI